MINIIYQVKVMFEGNDSSHQHMIRVALLNVCQKWHSSCEHLLTDTDSIECQCVSEKTAQKLDAKLKRTIKHMNGRVIE